MRYRIFVNHMKWPQVADAFPKLFEWREVTVIEVAQDQVASYYAVCHEATGGESFTLYGEDHRGYWAKADGTTEFISKFIKPPFTEEEFKRYFRKLDKKHGKEKRRKEEQLEEFGDNGKKERPSPLSYKPGVFVSKTHDLRLVYRVRYAKRPGQPLLVLFHGGGGEGTDNIKPLYGFLVKQKYVSGVLRDRDCTVLLPQFSDTGGYKTQDYIAAVKDLCDLIAADAQSDTDRIYCMGGSFGGRCSWLCAYLFPDYFACSMPMMGALDEPLVPETLTPDALSHMKDIPIWVSHSADDTVVHIDRDDEAVAVLRELGAPVKYTRVDGKGHHYLVPFFLKTEPWADWMFAQKRQNK